MGIAAVPNAAAWSARLPAADLVEKLVTEAQSALPRSP